jgi:DNA-directed RNA polymerase subunit M/transcription elongation factor TFIIS
MGEILASKVKCNECSEEFRITSIQVKPIKDDVELNYFACPHCNSEYVVSYTDTSIRVLQKKIQKSLAKIGNVNYDKAAAHKMLRKQRQKLAADMTALRARIEASS